MGGCLGPATAVEELLWTVGLKVTVRCGLEGGLGCDWRLGLGMRGVDSVEAIVDWSGVQQVGLLLPFLV